MPPSVNSSMHSPTSKKGLAPVQPLAGSMLQQCNVPLINPTCTVRRRLHRYSLDQVRILARVFQYTGQTSHRDNLRLFSLC